MIEEDTYFDEWPEDSPIGWWNIGRKKLNVVIRLVNQWILDGKPSDQTPLLLRHIDMGLQTWAGTDCGAGWPDVLREMQTYMKENFNNSELII